MKGIGGNDKQTRKASEEDAHASLIEEITERVRLSLAKDEDLGNLNVVHKLILPQRKDSEETTVKQEKLVKKLEPGSCLDLVCGGGEHACDGRSCVRIQSFQKEDLATWFSDITEKEKSEVQIVAECYRSTTVNIATALGFASLTPTIEENPGSCTRGPKRELE